MTDLASSRADTSLEPAAEAAPGLWRRSAGARQFVRHLLEMIIAMLVGMMAFAPVWIFAFDRLGWQPLSARPALDALVMATNMTIAMLAWMRFRGHSWAPTVEMGGAMYAPFLVLLIPLQLGLITGPGLMMLGHLLMIPAMIAVMLLRRGEYTHHHSSSGR
jgi:hypothetical protein